MTKRAFFLIAVSLIMYESFGQVSLNVFKHKKFIELEYVNGSNFNIEVENISYKNFDDNCKTTRYLNKNSYRILGDTIEFFSNYTPNCLNGNFGNELKIRKIKININKTFKQIVLLSRKEIKKIKYVSIVYYTENKNFKIFIIAPASVPLVPTK